MSSKQVTDRQKSADAVVAIGLSQADPIAAELAPLLTPLLEPGETLPDLALSTRLFARLLAQGKTKMIQADHTHSMELGDDPPVRLAREQAAEALSESLVNLREVLSGMYGPSLVAQVMKSSTPRDPVVLKRFAEEVIEALSAITLPVSQIPGAMIDKQNIIAGLVQKKNDLGAKTDAVVNEVREAQATLEAKNGAIMAYDAHFSGIARLLEGLLEVSKKHELARKVKPSARKPGQVEEEPPPADASGNPPPASPI